MQVPKLRFKEFNDEWQEKQLQNVCEICYGKSQIDIECENGKYNILGTGGIIGTTNHFLYDKPSVLIGRKGTIDKPKFINVPFWSVDTLFYTKINDNIVNPKFFYYCISHIDLKKYNEATGVPSLSTNILNKINTFIPSIEEQTKIANFLSLIDKKIELQTQLVDNLNLYKKGLLQKVFSNNSRWKNVKIGDILQYEQPNQYIVESTEYNDKFSIPVLTANKGFILGYTNENFGVYIKGECIIFDDFTMDFKFVNFPYKVKSSAIKILTAKNNNIRFIYQLLKTITLEPISHQRHYISVVQNIDIKIPSIEEQNRIAELFTSIDDKISYEVKKLENLKNYKKGLLQKMFI